MGSVATSSRWSVLPTDGQAEARLASELGLAPVVARVLVARKITDPRQARDFLAPSLDRDWEDPCSIPGLVDAVNRIEGAIAQKESIAVFGDFDVDGISATCLLTLSLRRLGATVYPFIPNRFGEGYGLSEVALERVIAECNPALVVTVDNGISAGVEVAWLRSRGVDVVVTDHHEPADHVPQDIPVCDPKIDHDCPSCELAGAGVALKVVCELGGRLGAPDLWRDYIDVATLGTLSDMMVLQGENRALVFEGVRRMRNTPRPGLLALAAQAKVDLAALTADTLPFSIIPRLNAAGRMGTTDVAFDLLMADDPARAQALAIQLEATNDLRRDTEATLAAQALAEAERTYDGGRVVVVGGHGWHEGVKGIVASRIVNHYHVPAIVFSITDGFARGSGRSVGSVDLFSAVERCSDMLVRFGGHAGAVGVTVEESRLDEFRDRIAAVLATLDEAEFSDVGEVTACVRLEELTFEAIDQLEQLQPFGQGNKKPIFAACGVTMRNRALVGADASHVRFVATDGVASVPAIMFRVPEPERVAEWEGAVDVIFEAINETWQGRTKPKLMVKDLLLRDGGASGADQDDDKLFLSQTLRDVATDKGTCPTRDDLSRLSYDELTSLLRHQMIGESVLLPAQEAALGILKEGRSCLAVMATGRGKSLIFHIHAAREAIAHSRASVFVYPLRALVSDQAFHLREALEPLGVCVELLTGESPKEERDRIYAGLVQGSVDVVLTTPEFLSIHRLRFADSGRVGFVVIDEAHHAGRAKGGERSAYLDLPAIRAALGNPPTLAVTATATDSVAREICRLCAIEATCVVLDRAVRSNLVVDDHRGLRDREAALVRIVSTGEKCVVYVSSRDKAVSLTRLLRHRIPELAAATSFYHAGLTRDQRMRVEEAFRAGELSCIVSTSAFGEGVNLPSIRHVVLFGLPFGQVEFNQMSGRAGRDGLPATIHLLFGPRDVRTNDLILCGAAPDRDNLVVLWRTLVSLSKEAGGCITTDDESIASASASVVPQSPVVASAVEAGLAIFTELGLVTVSGFGNKRLISVDPSHRRRDLEDSVRFVEGRRSHEAFGDFCDWVLGSTGEELIARINRPITPDFGTIIGEEDS